MQVLEEKTIGEIVAGNYRTASVFEQYGIDFCCNGSRSISNACGEINVDPEEVMEQVNAVLNQSESSEVDYASWPMDELAKHIEDVHHRYIEESSPLLIQYLKKIRTVHGDRHPELHAVHDEFAASVGELTTHMKKEELILFPFVNKLAKAEATGEQVEKPHFGTVENPVAMMMDEHEVEGGRFRRISQLTNGYAPPADACNTYMVTFARLKEFEEDLHLHIHLENNILFPRVIEAEKRLAQ